MPDLWAVGSGIAAHLSGRTAIPTTWAPPAGDTAVCVARRGDPRGGTWLGTNNVTLGPGLWRDLDGLTTTPTLIYRFSSEHQIVRVLVTAGATATLVILTWNFDFGGGAKT